MKPTANQINSRERSTNFTGSHADYHAHYHATIGSCSNGAKRRLK
jgi:hypothetical protein